FSTQRLVDLAVARVEINNGTLLLNQERIPFAVAGGEFAAGMSYSHLQHGYDGTVSVSTTAARWRDLALPPGKIGLHFLLRAAETELRSLQIAVGRSTLKASGTVREYNHPALQLQYEASLDLPEVAKLTRVPQLRAGRADLKGAFSYRSGLYTTQ